MLLPGFLSHARMIGYERRWMVMILLIQLAAVLFEGIGISIVLPILQYLNSSGDVAKLVAHSQLWRWMLNAAQWIGVSLNLVTLMTSAFLAIVLRQIFLFARDVYTASIQYELQRRVRDAGFDGFIHASLAYHDKVRAGDFVNELTTELERAVSAMTSGANLMGYVLLSCGYFVVAAMLSGWLTLLALGVLGFAAFLLLRLLGRIRELGGQVTHANQQMSSFLVERLKSVRLVRLSCVEGAEMAMLASRTQEQRDRLLDLRKMRAWMSVLIEPIILAMAFVLLYLSVTVLKLQIESIMLFFFILIRLVPVIREVLLLRQGYSGNLASVEVIHERLRTLATARDPSGGRRKLERLDRAIELRAVSFHYERVRRGVQKASGLDRLSLTIPAHQMTALVGPSGAGKSTLVDLLPRLRELQSGDILFDGVSQREFDNASLRRAISYAPQSPQIFNVSIAEHIRYGWPEAKMDDICQAARLAQAADFIDALPDGYNTMLGEGGGHLSGGERQRLDLARALVRQAPILVLDEPTSNLDAEAEAMFREALEKIRGETSITIIIIGHRLSTVMSADQIAVLESGRVTETGSHAELLARGGWYARACIRQHGVVAPVPAVEPARSLAPIRSEA